MRADGKNQLCHRWLRQSRLSSSARVALAAAIGVNRSQRLAGRFGCIFRRCEAKHTREQVGHRRVPIAVQLVAVTFLVVKNPGVPVLSVEQIDQRAHCPRQ
jgi:hypothetical protein